MSFEYLQEFFYGEQLILFHKVSNHLYALNYTGQRVWQFYKKGLTEKSIADLLADEFSISSDHALADVKTCLSAWKQAGIFDTVAEYDVCSPPRRNHNEYITYDHSLAENIKWYSLHCFKLAGRTVSGLFGDQELETILLPILKHLKVEDTDPIQQSFRLWQHKGNYFVALANGAIHGTDSIYGAVGWILFDLTEQTCRKLKCMAVLHGGAVKHGESALILAGGKGSGKSTLIAALQREGFEFLSDDICPLKKEQGLLVPVPMSMRIKSGSWPVLDRLYPSLKKLHLHTQPDCNVKYLAPSTGSPAAWDRPWPVKGLIFPVYDPGAIADIRPLEPTEALKHLIGSGNLGCSCVRSLMDWLENTPGFVIRYASLDEAKKFIATITTQIMSE